MLRPILALVLIAACGGGSHLTDAGGRADAGLPPDAPGLPDAALRCPTGADAGGACTLQVTAQILAWETQAPDTRAATVALYPAFDGSSVVELGCPPLASAAAPAGAATLCTASAPLVVGVAVTGAGLVPAVTDRVLLDCSGGCTLGSVAAPYPAYSVNRATLDAWTGSPAWTTPTDTARSALVVVTFHDVHGHLLAGVTPQKADLIGPPQALEPGKEVLFLAADFVGIEERKVTGTSGSALVRLPAGAIDLVTGTGGDQKLETVFIGALTGGVFFQEVLPLAGN